MPESHLWLVNHLGSAFTLGVFHQKFKQLENTWDDAVNIKRLSASHWSAWAIGHDHRVYIYVRSSDVPIRVPETTYENQRWSPIHKFSKKGLIKTDRPAWSNEAGTVYRPKESVRLPSAHWKWEGDWLIDDNLRGEVVGIEGWQYAIDFPAIYTPEKHWNSFVRKRKWIRFRRYSSTDLWARISDMEVVEKAECFIDISVGGFLMPTQPAGFLSVWAITNNGHVYVRTNVNHDNPEGSTWQELKISDRLGIINVSVGASNLVWAVTWDGNTLVRTEVTRNNIYGSGWVVVEHPDNSTRFMQVSVGRNSVWAISREGKVWFRKGTSGDDMFWSHSSAVGTSWVEMVGEMSQVAVSSNDQVFAIDMAGKNICFRTGVTAADPTGKTWQPIYLDEDMTLLQEEGFLSEGDICSCGDPDTPCSLHTENRPRLSSTTTSSSSISAVTNVEENCDRFISPQQSFPIYITEPFSMLESDFLCNSDEFIEGHSNGVSSSQVSLQIANDSPSQHGNTDNPQLHSQIYIQPTDNSLNILHKEHQVLLDKSALTRQNLNLHSKAPSTSQTTKILHHTKDRKTKSFQDITTITNFSSAENIKIIQTGEDRIFLNRSLSTHDVTDKASLKDDNTDHACVEADKNFDNLLKVKEQTFSALKICEKLQPDNYVNSSCDIQSITQESCVQKVSTLIPFSTVAIERVNLLKAGSIELLAKSTFTDQCLSKSCDIYESTSRPNKSFVLNGGTNVSLNVGNNEILEPSYNRLHQSADSHITEINPNVIKFKETSSKSCLEQNIQNKLNNDNIRPCLEVDDSSQISNNTLVKDEPIKHESILNNNTIITEKVLKKKKVKERRPKITSPITNDPNDDSILFKTFKTKKKRRGKTASTINDNSEKFDTISTGSDNSHSFSDKTELYIINDSLNLSPDEAPEIETDVDYIDGNNEHHQDYSSLVYQNLSAEASNYFLTFPILNHFSGNYLNTDGFSPSSAPSTLFDFKTSNYPKKQSSSTLQTNNKKNVNKNQESTVKASDNVNKPVLQVKDNLKPAFEDIDSNSTQALGSNKDITNTVVAENMKNNQNRAIFENENSHVKSTVLEIEKNKMNLTSTESNLILSNVHESNLTPNEQTQCKTTAEEKVINYEKKGQLLNTNNEINSNKHSTMNIQNTLNVAEYNPLTDEKQNGTFLTKVRDESKQHNQSDGDTTNKSGTASASGTVELCKSTENNNEINQEQMSKIEKFFNNKCNSLDSTSNSEEIIDFVTDLLASDDEVLDNKTNLKEEKYLKESKCLSDGNKLEEANQSPIVESSTKFNFQTQTSDSRSRTSSVANAVKYYTDLDDQEDFEQTMQATKYQNVSSAQSNNTDPKIVPLGNLTSARKVSLYLKSPSPSNLPTSNVIPLVPLMMSQPRLFWKWLDATSCVIDEPSTVSWLSTTIKDTELKKKTGKISKQLREDIMRKLQERNKKEVHRFKDLEQAIKRTTWVKKASMQIYMYGRKSRWIICNVELEQGIGNLNEGSLTIHYKHKGKQKNTQMALSEITCVKTCSDFDTPSEFVVYTSATNAIQQPHMLKAASENEAADWIGSLATANATAWNMNCPIAPGAVWSCTFIGDVFVSSTSSVQKHLSDLCWGQHGGHKRMIETGPSGVTWALGFDRMPYVYNGGYGGAMQSAPSEMSDNTHQIIDQHKVFVYENQTWFPVIGWCSKGVFNNDFHWLTESGRRLASKEEVKLPSSKCQWISDWTIDFSTPGGVDSDGWQYSSSLNGPFVPHQHLRSSYRRRRWFRQYKITVFGPWHSVGSLGLADLSVQIDPVTSTSDSVILWAVGANGDVLCRNGVSASLPKGQSWIHVATYLDKPFKSISVGGSYRVWGLAGDGSAWFRPGVSPFNPTGNCWLQVVPPPPGNFLLHQVSAGATSVWAVDTGDNLWRRENITPTFPEGTGWELVASRVKHVSVGPKDQVWIIADSSFSKMKHGAGVIYSRVGITSTKPAGSDWEVVIGSGWAHVSVRGISEIKQENSLSSQEVESSI